MNGMGFFQVLPLLLLVFGLMLLLIAYRLRQGMRPTGHVEYVDANYEATVPHNLLLSVKEGLAGMPHGLLQVVGSKQMIPIYVVEDVPAPEFLEPSQTMQLALYCKLVEMVYHQPVSYGLLRFADQDVPCNWTPGLADELEAVLTSMRHDATSENVDRSHQDAAVCRACPVRTDCDQALD